MEIVETWLLQVRSVVVVIDDFVVVEIASFLLPGSREFYLWSGCVDAGKKTAIYNLDKKRSVHILPGGEKELLDCKPGELKLYLRNRKGFVKLALKYGTPLGECCLSSLSSSHFTLSLLHRPPVSSSSVCVG